MSDVRRKNGLEMPFSSLQMLCWALFPVVIVHYFAFLYLLMWSQPAARAVVTTIYVLGVVVAVGMGYLTTAIDPADDAVLLAANNLDTEAAAAVRPPAEPGETTYCYLCEANVHGSSKHCRYCNKCVVGFDHHCKYLNTCVGKKTYRYFLSTVAAVCFLTTTNLILSLALLVDLEVNPDAFSERISSPPVGVVAVQLSNTGVLTLLVLSLAFFLPLVALVYQLAGFHVMLLSRGITTYDFVVEQQKKRRDRARDVDSEAEAEAGQGGGRGANADHHDDDGEIEERRGEEDGLAPPARSASATPSASPSRSSPSRTRTAGNTPYSARRSSRGGSANKGTGRSPASREGGYELADRLGYEGGGRSPDRREGGYELAPSGSSGGLGKGRGGDEGRVGGGDGEEIVVGDGDGEEEGERRYERDAGVGRYRGKTSRRGRGGGGGEGGDESRESYDEDNSEGGRGGGMCVRGGGSGGGGRGRPGLVPSGRTQTRFDFEEGEEGEEVGDRRGRGGGGKRDQVEERGDEDEDAEEEDERVSDEASDDEEDVGHLTHAIGKEGGLTGRSVRGNDGGLGRMPDGEVEEHKERIPSLPPPLPPLPPTVGRGEGEYEEDEEDDDDGGDGATAGGGDDDNYGGDGGGRKGGERGGGGGGRGAKEDASEEYGGIDRFYGSNYEHANGGNDLRRQRGGRGGGVVGE